MIIRVIVVVVVDPRPFRNRASDGYENFPLNLPDVTDQLRMLKTSLRAEGYPLPTHDVAVRPSYLAVSIHADAVIGRRAAHGAL